MSSVRLKNTYSVMYRFVLFFLSVSFLVRLALLVISFQKASPTVGALLRIFGEGCLFDVGVAAFFCLPYTFFLLVFPVKWTGARVYKTITYLFFFITVLLIMFSFFAEFTFWEEFESRFNFIAVDYLIYTYEVVHNINESYPLPVLIGGMLLLTGLVTWGFARRGYFAAAFRGESSFITKLGVFVAALGTCLLFALGISNNITDKGENRYQDELAKAGIYSFFSAFRNNELNYDHFYRLIDNKEAFRIMKAELDDVYSSADNNTFSIRRTINDSGTMQKPNVIMITVESLSADFMAHFGNKNNITPTLDSLWNHSIHFSAMYATGNRTVRGMEALSLAVPPTPGSSIVRRGQNDHLTTIGSIFNEQGYSSGFFYGGDGYFDNMNQYFGNNGYTVTDRGRKLISTDKFEAERHIIPDSAVHFENAWGIADEDLYDIVIKDADEKFRNHQLFYDFVMTTSNHRPFTYPKGKIDIPSGSGRNGAVKYTDYAIGHFLQKLRSKPWADNTVIIIVADHCASSAGKNAIDISKYHIPAMICNLKGQQMNIEKMCSQIDLYPTLFDFLGWDYHSNLYGMDLLSPQYQPRAFIGTYQKLAYLKSDSLVVLSPQQKLETYLYKQQTNEQIPASLPDRVTQQAIASYQTAYYLYKHGGLKQQAL